MTNTQTTITGFKGFNRDMTCRGFQFEEGKTYTHEGEVKACNDGFHFCENPIDIFDYYDPGASVFRTVTGSGNIDKGNDDSKVAVSEITISAEISLHDLITSGIKFFFSRKYKKGSSKHSTGDSSASSATGYSSASSATGDSSASSATGYGSASSATGDRSASSATGDASAAVCTGINSRVMAGKYGVVALAWWNEGEERVEMRCAETGCGDGSDGKLKANAWYVLDSEGQIIETAP